MTQNSSKPLLELVKPKVAEQPTPAAKPSMPKKRWSIWRWLSIIIVAVAVLAIGWFYGVPTVLGPVIIPSTVIRADLVQTVVSSGNIATPFRISVSSQITGSVISTVLMGQKVKAGDTLVKLDDTEAKGNVEQAKGILAQAVARVDQQQHLTLPAAVQSLAGAQANLLNLQDIYKSTATLADKGILATAALQQAKANLDLAASQVNSAQLQVASNQDGGNDFLLVKTQQTQAQAALDVAQTHLADTNIAAARDGTIISQTAQVGNVVQPGIELLQLSPDGQIQVVAQIDEKNLGLLAVGQTALASADAYSNLNFPVKVASIDPSVDLLRAAVTVKLDVDNPPPYLRQDMTVSVDIEVNRKPKALIVNLVDIHELKNGAAWVLKIENGITKKQVVKVGLVTSDKVEILDGLAENDQIVPGSVATITDGKRVRVGAALAKKP